MHAKCDIDLSHFQSHLNWTRLSTSSCTPHVHQCGPLLYPARVCCADLSTESNCSGVKTFYSILMPTEQQWQPGVGSLCLTKITSFQIKLEWWNSKGACKSIIPTSHCHPFCCWEECDHIIIRLLRTRNFLPWDKDGLWIIFHVKVAIQRTRRQKGAWAWWDLMPTPGTGFLTHMHMHSDKPISS